MLLRDRRERKKLIRYEDKTFKNMLTDNKKNRIDKLRAYNWGGQSGNTQ